MPENIFAFQYIPQDTIVFQVHAAEGRHLWTPNPVEKPYRMDRAAKKTASRPEQEGDLYHRLYSTPTQWNPNMGGMLIPFRVSNNGAIIV